MENPCRKKGKWLSSCLIVVVNHSQLMPARLLGKIYVYPVEILIVTKRTYRDAEALTLLARKFRTVTLISFDEDLEATVTGQGSRGRQILTFNSQFDRVMKTVFAPLPPYIKRKPKEAREYREFDLSR